MGDDYAIETQDLAKHHWISGPQWSGQDYNHQDAVGHDPSF